MALVRGCHVIDAGDPTRNAVVALQILSRGLMVNHSYSGTAAWAYYIDMVLSWRKNSPMVIFDVDEHYVTKWPCPLPQRADYGTMKMSGPLYSYIPITVLGFVNLSGFPPYTGPIGFV